MLSGLCQAPASSNSCDTPLLCYVMYTMGALQSLGNQGVTLERGPAPVGCGGGKLACALSLGSAALLLSPRTLVEAILVLRLSGQMPRSTKVNPSAP
jgi:hypothetical protein